MTILQGPALYRSHDLGASWSQYNTNIPNSDTVFSFAVGSYKATLAGSFVYVITNAYPARDFLWLAAGGLTGWTDGTPSGVTTNGSEFPPVVVTHPGLDTTSSQTAWLLVSNPPRVFVTTNAAGLAHRGTPWTNITGDLPTNVANMALTEIAVDPTTTSPNFTLYLGTSSGVYKTVNNGKNWTRWATNLPAAGDQVVQRLRIADFRGSGGLFKVYQGLWGSGVWWRDGSEP